MLKKIIGIMLTLVLVIGVVGGCSNSENEVTDNAGSADDVGSEMVEEAQVAVKESSGDKESYKFGYTCMDGTNPFFVILEETIRNEVEANGDELIATDPANDVMLQITQIEDMITQGIDAIFLNPAEAEGILPALDMLKEAGIPIINFDTEVADLSYVDSYVGSDNYNAGFVCGEDLVSKYPEGGDIIILDSPTMNSITDRTNNLQYLLM